ncbi:ATP-binding protein [Geopsychrobacter electrodiphilus]|uniref:ATP-binding protein n=1 Tax=Geopsychrobacter electrodiphilus TaxID=225196 RepID=UPI00036505B0|nr:LytS/YhcK type 5TM receptor domain-containing protein [Geopsychrobacter electrodiphilus]
MSSFTGLFNNAILLLAMGVIYDALGIHNLRRSIVRDILSGLLIGLVGIGVMLTPWSLAPGIFFDTRSVLLSLCALFFGLRPTLIAVAMTLALRAFQGGAGVYVGSLVIVSSAAIGLAWRQLELAHNGKLSWWNLYLFGMLVQVATLTCMLLLPAMVRFKVLAAITPPGLLIFPIGTMLLGLVLRRQNERRTAEKALTEHRHLLDRERGLLRGLIDSIPDAIFFKNTKGQYLGCNQAFDQRSGLSEQDIIGKTALELFDPQTAARINRQDQQVYTCSEPFSADDWIKFPDGQLHLMSTLRVQFRGLDGTLYGLAGISRDITERTHAAEERARLEDQLQQSQKIESIGLLAGGLAHDFNNILAGLYGNISLAKNKLTRTLPEHPGLRYLNAAEKSLGRATSLTNQLLTFAKGGVPVKEILALDSLIEDVVQFSLSGSKVIPQISQPDHLWLVDVDQGQMQQVFGNLTINAKQAMPEGGLLRITLENTELPGNCLPDLSGGKYVRITLTDNGSGIQQEHLEQVFSPYFTTKPSGRGLGLATVYSIIRKHLGHISVVSQLGQGTTFILYLPAAKSQELPQKTVPINTTPPQQISRILVMDDEEAIRDITQDLLEEAGFAVETAPDAKLALALYGQALEAGRPFDLVILDLTIPGGMGGLEVIKEILTLHPQASAIVSSGYADDPVMANYADYGFKGVVAKPYELRTLTDVVCQVLHRTPGRFEDVG